MYFQISHYAGICNKRLDRMGVGGRLSPKKPSLEDIDQSRLQIFRPSMFGGTLLETLNIQKDKFPSKRLPWILTTLTDQILGNKIMHKIRCPNRMWKTLCYPKGYFSIISKGLNRGAKPFLTPCFIVFCR